MNIIQSITVALATLSFGLLVATEPVNSPQRQFARLFALSDDEQPQPKIVSYDELIDLLTEKLLWTPKEFITGPEDAVYICPTAEEIKELLCFVKDRRENIPYLRDGFDCDDYATEMKYWATVWAVRNYERCPAALATGKAYVKISGCYDALFPKLGGQYIEAYHVLNFLCRADGQVFLYEPQTGILAPVESFIYEGSIEVLRLEY